jgi:hypothetical protein
MKRLPATGRLGGRLGVAVLAVGLLATTSCTGRDRGSAAPATRPSAQATSASPTPEQVELEVGEPASFRLRGTDGESSRVRLTVTGVTEGKIKDLSQFQLDRETRRSTPYYADVRVTNQGSGDLSGTQVTLWALDSGGTVRPPAEVVGAFRKCQTEPLPRRFTEGESARTCLLYLLPEGTSLQAVQYRTGDLAPYSWTVG